MMLHNNHTWKVEDKFGNILRIELRPEERAARIFPVMGMGSKLYFNVNRLTYFRKCLGHLIRELRIRYVQDFDSDGARVTRCGVVQFAMIKFFSRFNQPEELWFSLQGIVELRRKISDVIVEIKLAEKVS